MKKGLTEKQIDRKHDFYILNLFFDHENKYDVTIIKFVYNLFSKQTKRSTKIYDWQKRLLYKLNNNGDWTKLNYQDGIYTFKEKINSHGFHKIRTFDKFGKIEKEERIK